jgi:hypothetical protein
MALACLHCGLPVADLFLHGYTGIPTVQIVLNHAVVVPNSRDASELSEQVISHYNVTVWKHISIRSSGMFKFFGIFLVVLAVGLAALPMFTDCQSQGKSITLANGNTTPMKCHWTGVAELATGAPLAVVGVMMVTTRRRENLTYLSILGVVLGAVAIALPNKLIGVCSSPTMLCHSVMKPGLTTGGSLAMAIGIVGIVLARKASA